MNPASYCIIPCLARHPYQLKRGTSIVVIINHFLIGFEVCSTSWSPYLAPLSRPRTCDYTGLGPRGEPTSVIPLMRNNIKQIPNDLLEGPYISSSLNAHPRNILVEDIQLVTVQKIRDCRMFSSKWNLSTTSVLPRWRDHCRREKYCKTRGGEKLQGKCDSWTQWDSYTQEFCERNSALLAEKLLAIDSTCKRERQRQFSLLVWLLVGQPGSNGRPHI